MSTQAARGIRQPCVWECGLAVAWVLALADVWLTWRVAVHGPAVETGVGASAIISTYGVAPWALALIAGVTGVFLAIRFLHEWLGPGWAKIATGYVLGFLMYNVLTNLVIAIRVGAL